MFEKCVPRPKVCGRLYSYTRWTVFHMLGNQKSLMESLHKTNITKRATTHIPMQNLLHDFHSDPSLKIRSVLLYQSHVVSPQCHPELKCQPHSPWISNAPGLVLMMVILIQVVIWANGYDLAELIISHLYLQMLSLWIYIYLWKSSRYRISS